MDDILTIFLGKLKYIEANIVSEQEKDIQLKLLFSEYIENKEYMDLYNIMSYMQTDAPKWLNRTILLQVSKTIIDTCDDETMIIEFIHQGYDILKLTLILPPKDIPVNDILEFYIVIGEKYWKLKIYDTAIRAYDDALYLMKGLKANSISMLKLILRISKYRENLRQYQIAAQNSFLGYEIAVELASEGWIEAFAKHVEDNNLEIANVYAHATQALIWDNEEKKARNNIIRAIQAIAEIILVTQNTKNLTLLISTIISTFKTFRVLDKADNEVINILRMVIGQSGDENILEVAKGLINYCKLAYFPVIYTIMVISDAGSLVYSKDLEIITKSDTEQTETTLFDDEGKNLYSGLFTAMSTSMKMALGSSDAVNAIEYEGQIIMIEECNVFTTYLICDRETYELRNQLSKFTNQIDNSFKSMNALMVSSKEYMEAMIEPLFKKHFANYIPNNGI
ncbi:MAG: hypothetical protein INQ03_20615 [Candidatus Heimdallarchaeota archaeon]|nr:hypothetical protein [Candidatus Heimdallarchaeota archaeon]